jgi:hypothetical protein
MANAPTQKGQKASESLHRETRKEEREVETEKGSHLKKGEERVDERSRSAGNPDVGRTQKS